MRHVWQGWLVSNGGLQIPKFLDQVAWLEETFRQRRMTLRPVLNHQLSAAVVDNRPAVVFEGACLDAQSHGLPDFVLFWDKDVRLARMLERMGLRLFNTAETIAVCDDKSATHLALSGMGIPLPDTVVAPMNFPGRIPIQDDFVVHAEAVLGYPMVVKESFGSFGDQVYLASNREELLALHARLEATPHLAQRYIRTSHGRDVRLQVVGDRVVAAMLRQSATDFRANVSAGGAHVPIQSPGILCGSCRQSGPGGWRRFCRCGPAVWRGGAADGLRSELERAHAQHRAMHRGGCSCGHCGSYRALPGSGTRRQRKIALGPALNQAWKPGTEPRHGTQERNPLRLLGRIV